MENKYLLTTGDGTATLFLKEYEQAMHSVSGAYEESLLKHVIPSKILDCSEENLYVLDIGFGMGYNVLALVNEFLSCGKESDLNIISVEKENSFLEFMNAIIFNDQRDELYSFIKDVYSRGEGRLRNISLKVLFGDARETLKKIRDFRFNAVFQDPFSPSKNPELWSRDYFILIRSILTEKGIVTTYSSADHIRRAMIEAGMRIGRGPSVGKKREGTIAGISSNFEEITNEEMENIFLNIRSLPYEDPDLILTRNEILENRISKIKLLKHNAG